jgi:hypothetical protein
VTLLADAVDRTDASNHTGLGQCSGMTPDGAAVDVRPWESESPRLLRSNVVEENVVLPDFPHRPAGALFDAWPNRSSLCITALARLVRFPKGDAERVAAIAVSEDDVADVAWLAADAGMDDFAHDTRNVADPVGRRFEEVHPRYQCVPPC